MCGNDAVISTQLQQVNNVIVVLRKLHYYIQLTTNVNPVICLTRYNGRFLL
jgi:hypothetical protein